MTDTEQTRFDVDALRAIAGETTFARGADYHRKGQVEIFSRGPGRVLARVAGTENYRTEITGGGTAIGGACSCPAFEDRGICKHMVATALAANAAVADEACEDADPMARIRDHLKTRGVKALVDLIMDMAERDTDLFRRLDIAAATASGTDKALEPRLRKAIDAATRTGRYLHYREVSDWAYGVEGVLDGIADLIPAARADMALRLVSHALFRIEQAIDDVDDSDGHCGALLERARDMHLEACRAARPDPQGLARDLFRRERADPYGIFHAAAALYEDVLGEPGLAEFHRLAREAWEALPPRMVGGRARHEDTADYDTAKRMLDFFAERDGDMEMRIALRTKDLSSPWDYLELAGFCLANGLEDEALRHAEDGLWLFEDQRPDERLVYLASDLLCKAGRKDDALSHLWRAFETQPNLEMYKRLRTLDSEKARERAIAHLETRLSAEPSGRWSSPADLLVSVLMEEKMMDHAWAAVHGHGASRGMQESLARASERTHPAEALKAYEARVEELVTRGSTPTYGEAARLIAHMAGLRDRDEQARYVLEFKSRHGRKRNLMRLME